MSWFKRKFAQWSREAWESAAAERTAAKSIDCENRPEEDPILTFRIYSATNGQILEFRRWDRKNDRNTNTTYIIEKDKDIGEYVNKCLTLELMK
jgi:hypothetical protein